MKPSTQYELLDIFCAVYWLGHMKPYISDTGAVSGLMRTVKYTRDWKFRTRLQREEHSCFNVSGMITKAESETYPTYNFKTSADKQQFYN